MHKQLSMLKDVGLSHFPNVIFIQVMDCTLGLNFREKYNKLKAEEDKKKGGLADSPEQEVRHISTLSSRNKGGGFRAQSKSNKSLSSVSTRDSQKKSKWFK
mmetsp:Transcript_11505/g.18420  ORF Transcript_11505/g.18420 Transcript_11505/m.18420 type:complete len:101 (-) Transcript_11505:236-538(-)